MKNFNETWISLGNMVVKKVSLKKHTHSASYKQAVKLGNERNLGAASYTQEVIEKTPTGHGLKKMCTDDRKALEYKFNSSYYLALKERPFTDFPELLILQEKNGTKNIGQAYLVNTACAEFTDYIVEVTKDSLETDIANANYYACLNDESTDSRTIEQDIVYLLFSCEGTPTVKYFSVKSVKVADAAGIIESIETAFNRFGITSFTDNVWPKRT